MWKPRWLLALPLALAATASLGTSRASAVRDDAGMFSADAVQRAEADLNRIERDQGIPTTVETVKSLEGKTVAAVVEEHAERSGSTGIYVLIARDEHKMDVYSSPRVGRAIDRARRLAIQDTFTSGLKKGDFDAALMAGVHEIGTEIAAAHAQNGNRRQARRPGVAVARGNRGGFGLGSLLGIGLVIVGVLFFVRLIGSLFGGRGQGYPGPGGRMGAPGYGPGYGGGGGGGFMSSLFGGIGGAMAGNWLYDQFSGRHQGGMTDSSSYGGDAGISDAGTDATNVSGDWGGGGDAGGGADWGGGGGGGDWGGGGGDSGGGGDW